MLNLKKFNESFKDAYIPKKKPIRESKEAKPLDEEGDDFVESYGVMSDYLKESLKEDWKDAYKQFEAELDRAFADGVVDPLAVEDRIKILYNKHRGDKDWDIAYMRWTNINEDTKVDLTKKKGSMSNVLTNHKEELSEFKKLDDMISNIDKWFKDANIDTPASNRLLSKLKNAKDIKDAQFIVYNSILSGAGEKVLK